MKSLKIVSISAELDPFSKTGGLADVSRSLARSLHRLGHDIIAITPLYSKVIDRDKFKLKIIYRDVQLNLDKENTVKVSYYQGELMPGLPVYFVRCDKYFGRKKWPYGSSREGARFYLFDVAALKLISLLKFKADVIHCHDWHTGLIPYLKKKRFYRSKTLASAATVFTIHNLTFQAGMNWWEIPVKYRDKGKGVLPLFKDEKINYINFSKRAILNADVINTVSETYADEIIKKNFGQDLHRILVNRRHKLFGVVNGIDYNDYNPRTDQGLKKRYSIETIHRKIVNKRHLQKMFKLPTDDRIPIISFTSRIAEQKGFDLLLDILPTVLLRDVQLIIMGDGDKNLIDRINKIKKLFPGKIHQFPFYENRKMETLLYAGGDLVLVPSRFEPCGITQMKAFRYGCVPIVRSTGGLSDTVDNFDPVDYDNGNGFTFKNYKSQELLVAITRALETYKYKNVWKDLMRRGMRASFSWELPAKKYLELYKKAKKFQNEENNLD